MEQFVYIMQLITVILTPIMYLIAIAVLIIVMIVLLKVKDLVGEAQSTVSSIQQISQLPLQIVNSLLQKFL